MNFLMRGESEFAVTLGVHAVFDVGNSTTLTTGGALSASAGATLGLAASGNAVFDVDGSLALSVGAATTVTLGGPLSFTAPQIRLN
jgi:hypothetical protein